MHIDSFNKVTFLYNTGLIPPPFCYKYEINISANEEGDSTIDIDIDYYDRDEISEDEIYNEGFTLDDNFKWTGSLPQTWVQEIINKLNASNWKRQRNVRPGETGLMVKVERPEHAEDLEPADLRSWEVFIQEIIQACFELSKKEAPLYISYLQNDGKNNSSQLNITYSFAQRSISLISGEKKEKTISWSEGRKLLKYIFGIDYLPEEGLDKLPAGKGSYISPGDGFWYQLDAGTNSNHESEKAGKLNKLLQTYLD